MQWDVLGFVCVSQNKASIVTMSACISVNKRSLTAAEKWQGEVRRMFA